MKTAVRREIDAPLSALRASMESLAGGFRGEVPPENVLDGVVSEIVRVGRNVQALIDFAVPPNLRPISCNLEELARSAHGGLPPHIRSRVTLAIEHPRRRILIDGPLLCRCLGYLVTANVSRLDEALLRVVVEGDSAVFSLLCRVHGGDRTRRNSRRNDAQPDDESLVLVLAQREIERMGGELRSYLTPAGALRVTVHLPLEAASATGSEA